MPGRYVPQWIASLAVVFDGFGGGDSEPTRLSVIPKSFSAHLNGYKEADTFEVEFDAAALPFSPELVRSAEVGIYAAAVDSPQCHPEDLIADDTCELVVGLADDAGLHLSDDGRRFTISGRDYTCLPIDKQWDPKKRVRQGVPLDALVQELIDEACQKAKLGPGGKTLTVSWQGEGTPPIVGPHETKTNKRGIPVKEGKNYWDVIYSTCIRYGLIVFVRGYEVVISTPQTLVATAVQQPRKLVYGRNLASLEIERKLGKEMVPQIRVTAYDSLGMHPISALFPEKVDPVVTGVGTKKEEILEVVIHGITDPKVLQQHAETYYNAKARAEGTIKWATKDLTDLDDQDLLSLRAGDPLVLGWDPFNDEEMHRLTTEQRRGYLLSLGYQPPVADLVARDYDRIMQCRVPFYTRSMTVQGSADDGISLDGECCNFIAVGRDDASAQP